VLRPLYEQARRLSAKLDSFEMLHTLRGGNQEADRLANEAMDKGMGKQPGEAASQFASANRSAGRSFSKPAAPEAPIPVKPAPAKSDQQIFEGYVKGGVVHLIAGELPDGIFVKIIRG
jgi:probable phosphoglycerate mutase